MRLIAYREDGRASLGIRLGEEVVPLGAVTPGLPADPVAAIAALHLPAAAPDLARRAAACGTRRPLAGLQLLPPVPRPGKIVCIGLNYALHAKEGNNPIPDYPAVFMRGATSLVGPDAAIVRPKASQKLDWEAELVIVIGRRARHLSEADALSCVAGYSCMNEGSVRDYQRKSTQWTIGKNFDSSGSFGPEIVTPDEIPQGPNKLRISLRVNGETMQDSNTDDMIFSVPKIIATLSEAMTLEPGDVIATGTPSGVGYPRTPPRFMTPGDVVEVEIEGIGILRNTIVDEA
ncbi:fumarylacetoacetate hydrolase family protein [Roseomonas sp. CCTCC AB2023176]|uniref:fumarylacetoacetate hydrolase family protein n=1 Tax=Roseomonas sp. CCTCC AB2023176 TaxID=3342640 RepID=UPI0035E32208